MYWWFWSPQGSGTTKPAYHRICREKKSYWTNPSGRIKSPQNFQHNDNNSTLAKDCNWQFQQLRKWQNRKGGRLHLYERSIQNGRNIDETSLQNLQNPMWPPFHASGHCFAVSSPFQLLLTKVCCSAHPEHWLGAARRIWSIGSQAAPPFNIESGQYWGLRTSECPHKWILTCCWHILKM